MFTCTSVSRFHLISFISYHHIIICWCFVKNHMCFIWLQCKKLWIARFITKQKKQLASNASLLLLLHSTCTLWRLDKRLHFFIMLSHPKSLCHNQFLEMELIPLKHMPPSFVKRVPANCYQPEDPCFQVIAASLGSTTPKSASDVQNVIRG